jgi:drug/metabolite transporter (DMT)-like permease
MKPSSRLSRGYLTALAATILWSFTGIIISYLGKTYSLPALILAFWRDLFLAAGMAAALFFLSRERFQLDRAHWGFMALYGFTLAVFNSIWTFSVQYNGAAVATVMAFSSPAITAILSRFLLAEKFSPLKIFSILLSLAGIVFISGAYDPAVWNLNPLGIIFGSISGLFFAFYNLQGKHASDAQIDSWTALLYSFAWATVFLVLFNIGNDLLVEGKPPFADIFWLGDSAAGWGLLFFLGVAPTLGGFGLYTLSLRSLSPTTSNLIATLEPAFTALWAYLLLSEVLSGKQFIGGLLVFAGVVLLRFGEGKN